jgi:hypothetical protein
MHFYIKDMSQFKIKLYLNLYNAFNFNITLLEVFIYI